MHAIFKNSHGNENKNCGITSAKCITTEQIARSPLLYLLNSLTDLFANGGCAPCFLGLCV